jgi:phosphoribosyl 1,2-cyclic phosphate phosphodiesterase
VLFLGTGTSHGVPMIGCDCAVCRSSDPRDNRLRPSILIETDDGLSVLIDTGPDLRTQALRFGVRRVDAICYTHAHADHIMGLDDVRRFNAMAGRPMPVFGDQATLDDLRRAFAYAFKGGAIPGGGIPRLELWPIAGPFCLGRQEVTPVPILHGGRTILGFRFGRFAYLTDCSAVPDASMTRLGGLDVLVLDALRPQSHPTHMTLAQAVAVARRVGATRTYFTHMAHDLPHAATCAALPEAMALAYDGLRLEVRSG